MSDKKREYHRSIEVLQHIKETQPLYYILAFIYDSGYDKKDIVEMMKIIEADKKTNKVSWRSLSILYNAGIVNNTSHKEKTMSDFLGQEQSDDQWGPDSDCNLDNEDILLYEEGESEFEDDGQPDELTEWLSYDPDR